MGAEPTHDLIDEHAPNLKKFFDEKPHIKAAISAADGKMYYITLAGDLDVAGNYKIQAKVVLTSGSYFSSTATFKVHCNL